MNRPSRRRQPATESERYDRRRARGCRAAGELEIRRLCRTMPTLSVAGRATIETRIQDIADAGARRPAVAA